MYDAICILFSLIYEPFLFYNNIKLAIMVAFCSIPINVMVRIYFKNSYTQSTETKLVVVVNINSVNHCALTICDLIFILPSYNLIYTL